MSIKCKNCGTLSNYHLFDSVRIDDSIMEVYKCACGRTKKQVFWTKSLISEWEDGELKNSKNLLKNY